MCGLGINFLTQHQNDEERKNIIKKIQYCSNMYFKYCVQQKDENRRY